jgi:3-oxoacyl-[acyl-carrier protein] reductase
MNGLRLDGKVALVTGSSRGIGRAIALAMLDAGAKVVVTYRKNRKMAEEVVQRARRGDVVVGQLEVTSRPSIKRLKEKIRRTFGKIDILVNNAGINHPNDFDKIRDEEWEKVLATDLTGAFKVSQEMLPLIKEDGSIINIASVSGQYGGPRTTHYAVSKGGLITLTQNLAIFCASRNIRVNAVSPGLIQSEMAGAAKKLGVAERILLKRMGTPEEVANAVVFLASDAASYITAQTINVNGGLYF